MPPPKTTKPNKKPKAESESRPVQKQRHSLPTKTLPAIRENVPFRHTQSQNYSKQKSSFFGNNKSLPASIPEGDNPDEDYDQIRIDMDVDNVKVSMSASSTAKGTMAESQGTGRKNSRGIDNPAFVPERLTRNNSNVGSLRSTRSSVGNPSVRSLGIVKEQYCCCSRWTRCERCLFIMVAVLVLVIIILVITVALVAISKDGPGSAYDKIKNALRNL